MIAHLKSLCCFEFFCPMQPNLICTNIVANLFSRIYPSDYIRDFLAEARRKVNEKMVFTSKQPQILQVLMSMEVYESYLGCLNFGLRMIIASSSANQVKRKKQELNHCGCNKTYLKICCHLPKFLLSNNCNKRSSLNVPDTTVALPRAISRNTQHPQIVGAIISL